MSEPEVIGCSWIDEREFMGRGRARTIPPPSVSAAQAAQAMRSVAAGMQLAGMSAREVANRLKTMGMLLPPGSSG